MKTNIIAIFDSHEILTKDTSCFDFVKLLITEVKTVFVSEDNNNKMESDLLQVLGIKGNIQIQYGYSIQAYLEKINKENQWVIVLTDRVINNSKDNCIVLPYKFWKQLSDFRGISFTEHAKKKILYNELSSHYMEAIANNTKLEVEFLKNIFSNVYIKDVVERNKLQNVDEINTLVDILASAIGAPTNPTKISNTFKSERGINYSNKTISNHIDYLAEAFLIFKATRYDIKGRKYVGANLKYYFSDLGLRNARLNFRQQEPTHIMENIVYNELLIRGYNVDVGIVDVYVINHEEKKRVRKQLEVDFVVNQGSQRYYIQVAYDMTSEEKQKQEFNSFRNIPDSFKKIVVVNGTKKPWRNEEGFVIMGMKYFLLNADSLEF